MKIDEHNSIHVSHHRPAKGQPTFVFLNSIGATTNTWEADIAPALRANGYGTLSFDYRGQGQSSYGANARLDADEIISDAIHVFEEYAPEDPILVGLSIGGLFAMHAILGGVSAKGLVLVNTLRKSGALLEWINSLEAKLVALGGRQLLFDVVRPVLSPPHVLEQLRATHLSDAEYAPLPPDDPFRRMLEQVEDADWDVPYESITLPTLVLTGLHDRLFRVQKDVDELAERIPNAAVVDFPDAGHSIQAEEPDRLVLLLQEFASQDCV